MSNYNTYLNYLASEVLKQIDIVEIAQNEGLHLSRKGRSYFCLCPFHTERTPSFSISPQKQIFKCFGCGEGGNAIVLLSKLKNKSRKEIILQYSRDLGLKDDIQVNPKKRQEIKKRAIKYEFKKKHQNNFDTVYFFLCSMLHNFRNSMKKATSMQEVELANALYKVYDKIPYYEYLLDCMLGEYGEFAQVDAYIKAERIVKDGIYR